jgi:hypothetical protein
VTVGGVKTCGLPNRYGMRGCLASSEQAGLRFNLASIGWTILAIHAVGLGLVSLRYLLPRGLFPVDLPNFRVRHEWLMAHASFSSIALISGPWQFLDAIRRRWLVAHRWTGRAYCGAVLAGWLTSLPIAAHANTGAIASAGFLILGVLWIGSTAAGYLNIRGGQASRHRE